jgi:hypothetical protein
MAKARMGRERAGRLAGCLLLVGWAMGAVPAGAAPPVSQMLNIKPRLIDGAIYSMPSPAEQKKCKVELLRGRNGASGWLLRDESGKPVRRFYDTNGDKQIDVWSYYKDGVEVYRELDSTKSTGQPNQFRWLNSGGMRWGEGLTRDGRVAFWKVISAEEVSQELFQALANNDKERFKALLISEEELRLLKLPASQARGVRDSVRKALADFQATAGKVPEKAQWGGLESAVPQCIPADSVGTDQDLYHYPSRTIRCDYGDNKHQWFQTGEMVQVGPAWRLIGGPSQGDAVDIPVKLGGGSQNTSSTAGTPKEGASPEMQKLLDKLGELDRSAPAATGIVGANDDVYQYNLKRVEVLERVIAKLPTETKVKPEDREQWIKQLADCLSAACQNNTTKDTACFDRLTQIREQITREMPNTALAAYVTFRSLWAEYGPQLQKGGSQFAKVQKAWLEELKKFVQTYPTAEDTPDALLQLGMGCEFNGEEIQAKNWYHQLAENFPNHTLAAKAKGAVRRLSLDGQVMELSGPTLTGGSFNINRYHNKVVVVYYWASYAYQCPDEFAKLKQLLRNQGHKGVEVVCVNLDDRKADAIQFVRKHSVPGVQLYRAGGLNSPLAAQYGIMGLPSLFLLDKYNKVASRTIQINDLEDEVKKLLKK